MVDFFCLAHRPCTNPLKMMINILDASITAGCDHQQVGTINSRLFLEPNK